MEAPLQSIRVLDLSRILAGPWATQLLSDLGADVVKVERPNAGDDTRLWGPPFLTHQDGSSTEESAYFLCANRGKRSLTVDLSSSRGQEIIRRLASTADVFVENYKLGDMKRYGLDFETLSALNPKLVYCSITGFGQTGPYSSRAGYDFVIQAMGGLMSVTGDADANNGGPQKCGVPISDLMTAMYSSVAIITALYERAQSGMGQHIDMSLLDTQIGWLANQASNYLVSGITPKRWGNAHPNLCPYQSFKALDGDLIVAVGNDRQFSQLCSVLNAMELAQDVRFETNSNRLKHRETLIPELAKRFATKSVKVWLEALEAAGVPCGPINSIPTALQDEHVLARGMVLSLPHSSGVNAPAIANPIKFSRTTLKYHRAAPSLGEHTFEILREEFGYSAQEIEQLKKEGVV